MKTDTDVLMFVLLDENGEPFLETQNKLQMVMAMRVSLKKLGVVNGEAWYYHQGENQPYKRVAFTTDLVV